MNARCRYCRSYEYRGHTVTLPKWRGGWAHVFCYSEVQLHAALIIYRLKIEGRRVIMENWSRTHDPN